MGGMLKRNRGIRTVMQHLLNVVALGCLSGCTFVLTGDGYIAPDGARIDSGRLDSGRSDAGVVDSGNRDVGTDAGPPVRVTVTTYTHQGGSLAQVGFFAYQDGDLPWQAIDPIGATYSFEVTTGRYGIVYRCTNALQFVYATTAELTELTGGCTQTPLTATISGTAEGLAGTERGLVFYGGSSNFSDPWGPLRAGDANWSLSNATIGTHDLVAVKAGDDSFYADSVIVQRDLQLLSGNNDEMIPIYFGTASAFEYGTITALNAPATDENIQTFTLLLTANGTLAAFYTNATSWAALPASPSDLRRGSDIYLVQYSYCLNDGSGCRTDAQVANPATNLTVQPPPRISVREISVAGTSPYARFQAFFSDDDSSRGLYQVQFVQGSLTVEANLTLGWLGGTGLAERQWIEPDLSGVRGFETAWGAVVGIPTNWRIMGREDLTDLPSFASVPITSSSRDTVRFGVINP